MRYQINERFVKGLKAPEKNARVYFDGEFRGFGIRVTPNGVKTFVLDFQERRHAIGRFGPNELSVEAARTEASKMKERIKNGDDPLDKPEPEKSEPTMKELADDYIKDWAIPHKKPSSVKQDIRMLNTRVLPVLGKMKVSAAGKRDIVKLHNSLMDTPYEANRVRSLLSKMFPLAIGLELCEKNPCKGVAKFLEPKHDFWLTQDQLHKLELALNEYRDQNAANAIRLLIQTGSREGEVLNATWSQFDLRVDRETWTEPSHATKGKTTETIPLMPPALAILRQMQKSKTSIYLFPRNDDATKPRTTVRDCWEMSCRKAGLCKVSYVQGKRGLLKRWKPSIRINDLRHTFASHLVQRGNSLYLVGKLVGHILSANHPKVCARGQRRTSGGCK